MAKQNLPPLGIGGHHANPGELEFKPFLTLPIAVEAIRLTQHFDIHTDEGIVYGKPGDWLVHIDDELCAFTNERFGELYTPTTTSRLSELEAELATAGPPCQWVQKVPITFSGRSRDDHKDFDVSNPPSGGSAVTPPHMLYGEILRSFEGGRLRPPPAWEQPKPTRGRRLVAEHARDFFESILQHQEAKGLAKYGTALMTDNGRNALLDLFGELVDAIMYCSQALLEQIHREDRDE